MREPGQISRDEAVLKSIRCMARPRIEETLNG
jgi:hypothetical protein